MGNTAEIAEGFWSRELGLAMSCRLFCMEMYSFLLFLAHNVRNATEI